MLHTSSIVGLTAAVTALGLIVNAIFKSTGLNKKNGFPNAPWNWPIIGQTFWFFQGTGPFAHILRSRGNTDAINCTVLGIDQLFMVSPEAMKWAGMKGPGSAISSLLLPRWDRLVGMKSLAITEDPQMHKQLRHVFGLSISKDTLERRLNHMLWPFTFNAIIFFIFGSRAKDVEIVQANMDNFQVWMAGLSDIFIPEFMKGPYCKAMAAKKKLTKILLDILKERRDGMAADNDEQEPDGLNKILFSNGGEALTDEVVIDNIAVMIFAGHETSTSTISSCIHFWANVMASDEKDLLNQEIENANEGTMAELLALPVLDAFVKEVLRIATPATGMLRKLNQDAELCGHKLSAGTILTLPYGTLMYNPDVFENPHTFTVHRFLNKSAQDLKKHAYSYLPFGIGPRQCIGMNLARLEIKIFMFELLKSYVVIKSNKPSKFVGWPSLVFKPSVKILPIKEQ